MKDMRDRLPLTPSVQSPTLAKDLGSGGGNQSLLNNPNAAKAATPKPTTTTSSTPVGGTPVAGAVKPVPGAPAQDVKMGVSSASSEINKVGDALSKNPLPKKPAPVVAHFDLFDIIKGHLLDEGYADNEDAALAIMANMSEEWKQSIVEQSSIGARAAKVVDDQRQGYHGDADALNKLQDAASKSMGRLKRGQGPVVTPGLPAGV